MSVRNLRCLGVQAEQFKMNERLSRIPQKCWGTLGLTEKIGKIQAQRVDECLPKIKEAVRDLHRIRYRNHWQ